METCLSGQKIQAIRSMPLADRARCEVCLKSETSDAIRTALLCVSTRYSLLLLETGIRLQLELLVGDH